MFTQSIRGKRKRRLAPQPIKRHPNPAPKPVSRYGVELVYEVEKKEAPKLKATISSDQGRQTHFWKTLNLKFDDEPIEPETSEVPLDSHRYLKLDQSKFPLENYDSDLYETHTPKEWLEISPTGRAMYQINKEWKWKKCNITGFDAKSNRYEVEFANFINKKKLVKRLDVCFDKEDKDQFAKRLESAFMARELHKGILRLGHYIETNDLEEEQAMKILVTDIQDSWLKNIETRATSYEKFIHLNKDDEEEEEKDDRTKAEIARESESRRDLYDIESNKPEEASSLDILLDEAKHHYSHNMKRAVLFRKVRSDSKVRSEYFRFRLPAPPTPLPPPAFGKVSIPVNEPGYTRFVDALSNISKTHFIAIPEVVGMKQWARGVWVTAFENKRFVDLNFFKELPPSKKKNSRFAPKKEVLHLPCDLEPFNQRQHIASETVGKELVTQWRNRCVDQLVDRLQDCFNFFESNEDSFKKSRLFKLFKVVELQMRECLRHIVQQSTIEWTSFIHSFTPHPALVTSKIAYFENVKTQNAAETASRRLSDELFGFVDKLQEDFRALNESLNSRNVPPMPPCYSSPLFAIKLHINDDDLKPRFSPSRAEIESALLSCLSHMESKIRDINTVGGELMSLMQIKDKPIFNVGTGDDDLAAGTETILAEARKTITELVELGMLPSQLLLAQFRQYCYLVHLDSDEHTEEFFKGTPIDPSVAKESKKNDDEDDESDESAPSSPRPESEQEIKYLPPSLEDSRAEIARFCNAKYEILKLSYDEEPLGLVSVDVREIKEQLVVRAERLALSLMIHTENKCRTQLAEIIAQYDAVLKRLAEKPNNERELADLKDFIAALEPNIAKLKSEVADVSDWLDMICQFNYNMKADIFSSMWSVKEYPVKVEHGVRAALEALEAEKVQMMEQLEREKQVFEDDLEKYADQVKKFETYGDWSMMDKIVEASISVDDSIQTAKKKAQDFNEREKVFGWTPSGYGILDQIERDFEPFFRLWTMSSDFKTKQSQWLTGPFLRLDAGQIEKEVNEWWTASYKLSKSLATIAPGPSEVAAELRRQTDEFKKNIPVIQALASPALCDRHWQQLSERIGGEDGNVVLVPDDDLTLEQLVQMEISNHWEIIEAVTIVAEKEYSLDRALHSMIAEWEPVEFEAIPYKESGTYVVKSVEDIVTLLDDQIVKTQTMMGSPFIKPIQAQAKAWEKKLQLTQNLIDEWLAAQRSWLYLEPIFSSDDIMRQMPTEGRRFAAVDTLWRTTMADTVEHPRVMEPKVRDGLYEKFVEANKRLDQIQKGLNDYLEVKRLAFPRFYFLSNDELLEILSQTKEPRAVQPFLSKCFEGMARVVFKADITGNPDDLIITDMISSEGEQVSLLNPVDTNKGANKGNVENWLLEVQSSMRLTVKKVISESIEAYPKATREDWILNWPGQVILCVSQLYWTNDITKAISENGVNGIKDYLKVLNVQLDHIVELVRAKLTKLQRTSLGALCVIDVHARDVVEEMCNLGVSDLDDFNWMSQLRYYWEEKKDDYNRYGDDPFNMLPRIVNATVMYGYEYLGNSSRLIITPLTDRCYRTMMGAVSLMYGGAPAGPAGTGKTETVKDLSKAVAIQCVVFNCSDGLDYLAMAKFFKGLAASGAWACFDEFNRIELEVLSVIAQQLLTILKARRGRVQRFLFEGTNLPLNPDCNSFITMNPGYAGRSELPDNLKALFRPCAMMVPDYALIAEIKLYSFGFSDARNMARKLTQVLRLCSEQLSSQKHYDYGMRAVFSILVRAGDLRQKMGEIWTEDLIVLSSINDVNLPKFTTNDVPLFRGITSDLFPGVDLPTPDYGPLIPTIKSESEKQNLQTQEQFIKATVQLYETVLVRHGLMVVGETMSGKTAIIHTLAKAMTTINDGDTFVPTRIHSVNPKSITQGQLYGNFDDNTHEWTDGILAVTFRQCCKDPSADRHWIVFDGPVDAVWIENMNTVLDDNKKLCLNSGEIIKMSGTMTMMFEPQDLEEASPATVSRVGMVYMEQVRLGWEPLLASWLNTLPPTMEPFKDFIINLFHWLLPPLLYLIGEEVKVPLPVTPLELMASCLRLYKIFLQPISDEKPACKPKDMTKAIEAALLQAMTWTLGVVTDTPGRKAFDEFLRNILIGDHENDPKFKYFWSKNPKYSIPESLANRRLCPIIPPDEGVIYDFYINYKTMKWQSWLTLVKDTKIPRDANYHEIVVPTIATIRNSYIIDKLLFNGVHVLCTGDTGTGKTVTMVNKLLNELDQDQYMSMFLNFSAQTSANQTQDIIDSKLSKRRKGVFGPPLGKKAIIFVDDLNMPAKEEYGAQPPIELLRQWMDHEGWYDRKDCSFRKLVDVQFATAMGPPGGGRTFITQRYVRHFNVLGFVPFDDNSLQRIFGQIVNWFMTSYPNRARAAADDMVKATIDIYATISRELLPTPAKSHYTFNLRDLSKVFQGVSFSSADHITDNFQLIRLWGHECFRVFHDRLVSSDDREWFIKKMDTICRKHFKVKWSDPKVRGKNDILILGNFMEPGNEKKVYVEVEDHEKLNVVMQDYLEDYNNLNASQMHLVLFQNAIEHIARISRIITQPFGNALLVGVGGSGRKSLTSLAVFMQEYTLFQVEIARGYGKFEWHEDLKRMLQLAGQQGKPTVFLFSDAQIVNETFVEDINNILNTGEVPNLFLPDELSAIIEDVAPLAAAAGRNANLRSEVYAYFVERARTNLHVVLAFSPIGDDFRNRLRMFPALVNCCTIDWFTEWPEEALYSVGKHFLDAVALDPEIREGVISVCVDMQRRVTDLSLRFKNELRRHYYVTPTSYLELINTFKNVIGMKREEVSQRKSRYENGLTKLLDTEEEVGRMKTELEALQPRLKVASEETDKMLIKIQQMQKEADVKKGIVEAEEKVCSGQANEARAMQEDCEAQLAEAIPAMNAAVKALKALKKDDVVEVKSMKKPPGGVKLTMEAICIMLSVKPKKIPDPNGRGKIDDYWEPAQKVVLNDPKFLNKLMTYDKDNIPVSVVDKVRKYVDNPDFTAERILKASAAAGGLCKWVHAIIVYDRVAKIVAPKKAALKEATASLEIAESQLREKQEELQAMEQRVAELQEELKVTVQKKEDLANQVDECAARLDRAERLIGGLGGEKTRWTQFTKDLQYTYDNLVGDILLSSGIIAYLGAFTAGYRQECVDQWSALLIEKKIPSSKEFDLVTTLGDQVEIRDWTIAKLPNDQFSISNAIMMKYSNRWPLMIDPQGQANKWVRNTCGTDLKIVKQSQASFVRTIENCVQFGKSVLLENVPESIDPILENLLTKQIVKVGGQMTVKIGDNVVEYDPAFKLYITTKLRNPHFSPETCVKVNLLNFVATPEGLLDQMLGIVVKKEKPELEAELEQLILQDAESKRQLKAIEDEILRRLAESKGNILDDEELIATLAQSKKTSDQIMEQVKIATASQQRLSKTRLTYKKVAHRVSILFFCIADLASVDPMYQYSLDFYINLFLLAIDNAEKFPPNKHEQRLEALNNTFTQVLYSNICRSLFEKDKLLFSFLLCTKIMVGDGKITPDSLRFLLQGSTSMDLRIPNPLLTTKSDTEKWLTDKAWADVLALAELPEFKGFEREFGSDLNMWHELWKAADPLSVLEQNHMERWTPFEQLLVIRCLRPDVIVQLIQRFVSLELGQEFIDPPTFDVKKGYDDSNCASPIIFVLSPGADPMSELLKLAERMGLSKRLNSVSLGQGQGPIAENAINEAVDKGTWVCLQNVHLAESWMSTLERLCEGITPESTHTDFRLWLTSMPSPKFPVSVLQNSIKMTMEPPKGMRASLLGSYVAVDGEWFEECEKPQEFKKLLFGLCFFHATVRERRKFGALGWNIPYEFSEPDLRITMDQLKLFLDDYEVVNYDALRYLAGECNYGGRVTDDKDRRLIMNILSDFYTREIVNDEYRFSPSGVYYAPEFGELDNYKEYIKQLPFVDQPEVFGLHENANITCAIQESNSLLECALSLQPRASGGSGKSWEESLNDLSKDILTKLPEPFDIEKVEVDFPVTYNESMNTVLCQELMRFNKLLITVRSSLQDLQKAIKGLVVMSEDLESVGNAMVNGWVPEMWKAVSYPSLKPLGSYINDLLARLVFFQKWIDNGSPSIYWVSGFFFTQSFLTGTRQNFARKYTIPIDVITYDFEVLSPEQCRSIKTKPDDGAYINGLFLEGANWEADEGVLIESNPKELFVQMPIVWLIPKEISKVEKRHIYECPVYKTSERKGALSTTGHSTNFVISISLPMSSDHEEKHWVKRGVAMLTQLDD